ncbi:NADPH-dependent FMN reductase [Aquimarina sp. MAR_2010_214]|uniref:flavodoxin family protein n=1 Tax=Aquimarina sp. MAR_2010_214 TaxID=1250026 RepID=UPI000C700F4F|nr:NAD(P)H-dependent oxidoreductase [Aquimarina sp. MAR_2010_214]PKV52247.1 NADPH-dependent FMN reductase [Aquimarina sp. MAR_2010_214]
MKGVILQGSSKSNGNTNKIALFIKERTGFDIIDLKSKNIGPYDYDFKNRDDDFLPTIKEVVENYDTLIFATPVYWYAMSGIMKTFMDRITDCIKIEKTTGRKLRGKKMGMISCGSGPELKEGFTMPFIESANYLDMHYLGDIHTWIEDESIPKQLQNDINIFISENIKKKN